MERGNPLSLEELIQARNVVRRAIRKYLDESDWLEVTTSTLTSLTGACEIVCTFFTLPYFSRKAHLSQTAQLQLELLVKKLKRKVWTYDRSFRAETEVTPRHLTEFSLFELEAPGFTLRDIQTTLEGIIRSCTSYMVANQHLLAPSIRHRLSYLTSIEFPLRTVEYTDAIGILNSKGVDTIVGQNLGMREELDLPPIL